MRSIPKLLSLVVISVAVSVIAADAQTPSQALHAVITNDDNIAGNSASIFLAGGSATDPILTPYTSIPTGGQGIGGGYFGTVSAKVVKDTAGVCAYISDAGTGDIVGINLATQTVSGKFKGSAGDDGTTNGIGLAVGDHHLYAGYTFSNTIATFQANLGCNLTFVADTPAAGLAGGSPAGMALHGNMLVVTYEDGSIESFNVASGVAESNGDKVFSTGSKDDNFPAGVDISADGHFAIFGDTSFKTVIEVSDISSGKLTPTKVYLVGSAINSSNILLSPDQSVLWISNNQGGRITAARFNKKTGAVSAGCKSKVLKGVGNPWTMLGGLALYSNTGTGNVAYVAEYGDPASIGIVSLRVNGNQCSLTESPNSPVTDTNSPGLLSIGAFPLRSF